MRGSCVFTSRCMKNTMPTDKALLIKSDKHDDGNINCNDNKMKHMGVYFFTVVGPGSLNRWYDSRV